jgi:putative ABC transport system ATP-binding protein
MLYELRNVSLRRQHGDASFELNVRRLEIRHGEFSFIVGESGCGKSTLLDTLALLLKPNSVDLFRFKPASQGEALDTSQLRENQILGLRRRHMGHVLQSGGLIPSFNVRENILLSARLAGTGMSQSWFTEIVERLGLQEYLKRKPGQLSGGQRQRVAIARAVLHRPAIILADEPTAAVDQARALEICEIFRSLSKDSGCTVIMVTHNQELAALFGDRTLILKSPTRCKLVTSVEVEWSDA